MGPRYLRGLRFGLLGVLVAGGMSTVLVGSSSAADPPANCTTTGTVTTCVFAYTGAAQTWTVPAGVTQATFDVYGAAGGTAAISNTPGGAGGRVTATLPVSAGSTYQLVVGGAGTDNGRDPSGREGAGVNGGGAGGNDGGSGEGDGGGGGGASDVRSGSCAATLACGLEARILVGGGGGGGGAWLTPSGGNAGNPSGAPGGGPGGGGGGSQSAGGAGGVNPDGDDKPGKSGALGLGGAGASGAGPSGGGGGGGYYGGGGGAASGFQAFAGGGGGGGSSFGPANATFSENPPGLGNGQITITFCPSTAGVTTCVFASTGAEQSFTVPGGVSSVHVVASGAGGGSGSGAGPGGRGAVVSADLPVTQGDVLYLEAGGGPTNTGACFEDTRCIGGFNGGGSSDFGGGGGGASDVRTTGQGDAGTLASRLLVAAGGGGGGELCASPQPPATGAGAGGDAGAPGAQGNNCGIAGGTGGRAGTSSAGGTGGTPSGHAGALGIGGDGAAGSSGAGGGGLYGGGSGGEITSELPDPDEPPNTGGAGGGGGGSNLVPAGGTSALTTNPPQIVISYTAPKAVSIAIAGRKSLQGHSVASVAVLSTSDFDARSIDPKSVCFGDAEDPTQRDCTERDGQITLLDVNGDRKADALLQFETNEAGVDPGDTQACLTGKTFDGTPIAGCATIVGIPRVLPYSFPPFSSPVLTARDS